MVTCPGVAYHWRGGRAPTPRLGGQSHETRTPEHDQAISAGQRVRLLGSLEARHSAPLTALHPSPVSPPACVAVVGAGGFGQFCLDAYRQTGDISVAAVADPN